MKKHPADELFRQALAERYESPAGPVQYHALGGGSINRTFRATTEDGRTYFLKLNSASAFPKLFEKEKNGLEFLAASKSIRTPGVIACLENDSFQILVLEWIEPGPRDRAFWTRFGSQLASLHHVTQNGFGFHEDNYMGSLPQCNLMEKDWNSFFVQRRLEPQLRLAREKGLLDRGQGQLFESLYAKLEEYFEPSPPALLHGDLWSGNFVSGVSGEPVLVDPAVYFGHRGMDLAMTTLFGGFDPAFYEAYDYHFPLPPHFREQWDLCNLYPLLIHLNLFGEGYLSQIAGILRRYA